MIIILKICTSTHLPVVPHVCASIVSGKGLLPFQHQAISSVPEPCWLNVNWTLRNKSSKIYFTLLAYSFVYHVHKIWIELNLNWKKMNWIGIELKDSESDLIWIGIELNWKILNPTWIGIELNWKKWIDPSPAWHPFFELSQSKLIWRWVPLNQCVPDL